MSDTDGSASMTSMHPDLLPLVPLIAVMWEDRIGSDVEVTTLRAVAEDVGLAAEAQDSLVSWTEPAAPPTPTELARLGALIANAPIVLTDGGAGEPHASAELPLGSLADLGLALWRGASPHGGTWNDPDAAPRLREAEEAMGVLGAEAARRLRPIGDSNPTATASGPRASASGASASLPPAPIDIRDAIDTDHREIRDRVLALLEAPQLGIPLGLPHDEYRERVLEALVFLADEGIGGLGFEGAYGGGGRPGGSVAAFESLAFGDLSVLVKFGVQFGLFGGSIQQLGTKRHHETYIPDVVTLALPGCYAMTETGHGSNVRDLETTATFDAETSEFVVHSPTEASGKDWIGNAARHGRLAVVFARLLVSDEDHGVHAVLVPIRDERGEPLAGIRIEDRGLKLGLNGVDNGRIWFDSVRVPKDNLLDRFASIDDQGLYQSPILSSGRRFFTMLSTLVAGRVSIASAALSATKRGLTIAVRYASDRHQFGPSGAGEVPILSYTTMQRTLMPRLAATYALHFALRALQARFDAWARSGEADPELEVLAAGLKSWASDHCTDTLVVAREACGGQGYLAENHFAALKADTDIFTTFEGANVVLYQLAAKGLLSRYRDEMGSLDVRRALRYLGERAETSLIELNPVTTRRTDTDHLLDPAFHRAALEYREDRLLRSVAMRMRARLRDGMDSFEAVNEVQDHLVAVARAHVERIMLDHFHGGLDDVGDPQVRATLERTCALYALSRIEEDRGWYLESGYLEPAKSRAIRALVSDLCAETAEIATALVGGFGIPDAVLPEIARR